MLVRPNDPREAGPDDEDPSEEEQGPDSRDDDAPGDGEEDNDESPSKNRQAEEFFDPNKVPPQLKGAWKKMQAAFTKRTQGASLYTRKAQAFDKLVRDPRIQKIIMEAKGSSDKEDKGSKTAASESDKMLDAFKEILDERLRPIEDRERRKEVEAELKTFKKRHKDWKLYETEMEEIMNENPHMSLERVYKLAKAEADADEDSDEDDDEDNESLTRLRKKANAAGKSSGKSISREDDGSKRPTTIREAFLKAKKDAAKKG